VLAFGPNWAFVQPLRSSEDAVVLATMDEDFRTSACERLRALVPDCMSKHMYKAAIFFAGKLCSMSDNHPDNVYLLAQVQTVARPLCCHTC
jgi:hypothetical protein